MPTLTATPRSGDAATLVLFALSTFFGGLSGLPLALLCSPLLADLVLEALEPGDHVTDLRARALRS
jgi:hypothetical protein